MILRFLTLLIFFSGLSFIVIGYVRSAAHCPPPKVIYRFVPRSFKEEQEAPVLPSTIFADLFNAPSPFVGGFSIGKLGPTRNNDAYISQT